MKGNIKGTVIRGWGRRMEEIEEMEGCKWKQ